jgi:hypothetical protein
MVLVIHDERTPNRAIVSGIGAVWGHHFGNSFRPTTYTFRSIQYYNWNCTQNCIQPEFQWIRLVKETYEVISAKDLQPADPPNVMDSTSA